MGVSLGALLAGRVAPDELVKTYRPDPAVPELLTGGDVRTRRLVWAAVDRLARHSGWDDLATTLVARLDREHFGRLLTDFDSGVRRRAWDVLANHRYWHDAPQAREALLVLSMDAYSYAWRDCAEVLRRAGSSIGDELADAAVDAEGAYQDRVLAILGVHRRIPLPDLTAFPDAYVHCWSCDRPAQLIPARRCRHLPVLLEMTTSTLDWVPSGAVERLAELGPGMAEVLHAVRRSRHPARRGALGALAEFGWADLPPADLAALLRLIRLKQRSEVIEPVKRFRPGTWYAIPTTDQAAVLEAFELVDPIPATLRTGFAVWHGWEPVYFGAEQYRPGQPNPYGYDLSPEIFVSPALDGWTLVMPNQCSALRNRSDEELYQRLRALGRRFGAAHFYSRADDGHGYYSEWCIAQNDVILIHTSSGLGEIDFDRDERPAAPASLEDLRAWLAAHDHGQGHPRGEPRTRVYKPDVNALRARFGKDPLPPEKLDNTVEFHRLNDEFEVEWEYGADAAACRLSVGLETLGTHTRVEGTGVLVVESASRDRIRRGRLPI